MAGSNINAGEMGRSYVYAVDPLEIVVPDGKNGRWQPHTKESIDEMVHSYESVGKQLQPVQVKKIVDNRLELVLGWRRWAGMVAYNEKHPDKPMKLQVQVVTCNDEEAFMRNIEENRNRKETSCVDDAYNARRLTEDYGWTLGKVAEFFRCEQGYVGQVMKLLALPKETQLQVHNKKLSYQAALGLVSLPKEEQVVIIADINQQLAENPQAKVKTEEVVQKVREAKISSGGKGPGLSMKELKTIIESLTGEDEPKAVRDAMIQLQKVLLGKLKADTFKKNIRKIIAGDMVPA